MDSATKKLFSPQMSEISTDFRIRNKDLQQLSKITERAPWIRDTVEMVGGGTGKSRSARRVSKGC